MRTLILFIGLPRTLSSSLMDAHQTTLLHVNPCHDVILALDATPDTFDHSLVPATWQVVYFGHRKSEFLHKHSYYQTEYALAKLVCDELGAELLLTYDYINLARADTVRRLPLCVDAIFAEDARMFAYAYAPFHAHYCGDVCAAVSAFYLCGGQYAYLPDIDKQSHAYYAGGNNTLLCGDEVHTIIGRELESGNTVPRAIVRCLHAELRTIVTNGNHWDRVGRSADILAMVARMADPWTITRGIRHDLVSPESQFIYTSAAQGITVIQMANGGDQVCTFTATNNGIGPQLYTTLMSNMVREGSFTSLLRYDMSCDRGACVKPSAITPPATASVGTDCSRSNTYAIVSQRTSAGTPDKSGDDLPKVCLSMIVKNEAHIILEALTSLVSIVDTYCIVDTGSTDDTIAVIKRFYAARGVVGTVVEHCFATCDCHADQERFPFFHFGQNRTFALDQARGMAQYVLVFDADDRLVGECTLPAVLTADQYRFRFGVSIQYVRSLLLRNAPSLQWRYNGAVHEYLQQGGGGQASSCAVPTIDGVYYVESRRLGDRSKAVDKYTQDAHALQYMLKHHANQDKERNLFYCAQSFYDAGQFDQAASYYVQVVAGANWIEERYCAQLRLAHMLRVDGKTAWPVVEHAYMRAYNLNHGKRVECLYEIVRHYRALDNHTAAYFFGHLAFTTPLPTNGLFVDASVYTHRLADELGVCAFWSGHQEIGRKACQHALKHAGLPDATRTRIEKNLRFCS
jgi:glycosyltransferase involved in cell wall biosynthesis